MVFSKRLILFSLFTISFSSFGLTVNNGAKPLPEWCSNDASACYLTYRNSEHENNRVKAVLFYIQYHSLLEKQFEFNQVLNDLDEVIEKGSVQAMLVKASIYSSGQYVNKDYNLVISILEDVVNLEKGDKSVYSLLGGAYANLFLSNVSEVSYYHSAKLYLAKAFKLGNHSVAFEMGYLLLTYGDKDDFFDAEEYLRYMYINGNEEDKERFYNYLDLKSKMLKEN
ncbi:hypothetical protein [Vibrio genomosp. F10]|uniref:hypothetical protein n=1 Tax=Vibrio genomosp. F10 TaxID=723171 RepID=UPI0002FB6C48|nr:hypothetical protein [Vibrio genomosp. F10]OEE88013.1 hypothetical protein A1QK_19155 [Vibrio genomosp. F10 str. 9ZD137]